MAWDSTTKVTLGAPTRKSDSDRHQDNFQFLEGSGGAAKVGIADAGGKYTGTTVEAALQEATTLAEILSYLPPVGVIIAWLPGYFTGAGNVGYAAVAISLPSKYKECDGTEYLNADSPIYNAAGRFLPDIDDRRYLAGNTPANAGTPTAAL